VTAAGSPPGPPRSFTYAAVSDASRYTRLFSVTVTHNYYTQQKGLCRDFKAVATPATAGLMASLGLLLKDEGAGFSLFYTPDSLDKICAYLRREAQASDGGSGFWSRLTFLMELRNPEFVGITALPIETKSSKVNLYGCNSQAHDDDETVLLSQGPYMGGESLYPVAASDLTLKLPRRASAIYVTDISGATVVPAPGGPDVPIFGAPGAARSATVDLSGLPYDLYTIVVIDRAGRRIGAPLYPLTVLYVPPGDSMALLDILLTRPEPDMDGVYPITPLFGGAPPKPKQCGNIAYRRACDLLAILCRLGGAGRKPERVAHPRTRRAVRAGAEAGDAAERKFGHPVYQRHPAAAAPKIAAAFPPERAPARRRRP
jgi:hypothetical protein